MAYLNKSDTNKHNNVERREDVLKTSTLEKQLQHWKEPESMCGGE